MLISYENAQQKNFPSLLGENKRSFLGDAQTESKEEDEQRNKCLKEHAFHGLIQSIAFNVTEMSVFGIYTSESLKCRLQGKCGKRQGHRDCQCQTVEGHAKELIFYVGSCRNPMRNSLVSSAFRKIILYSHGKILKVNKLLAGRRAKHVTVKARV